MRRFAALLDSLSYTPARNGKLRLLEAYFATAPDPDRGHALAALTGALDFPHAKPAVIRDLVKTRIDPVLFALSYDYVGDLAETTALIWPEAETDDDPPRLADVVDALGAVRREDVPALLAAWLDRLDATGRWALLKLITGALRIGVSTRLAKTALARFGDVPLAEVEEVWHTLAPPYAALFAWLDGRAPRPEVGLALAFRPLMLANPLDDAEVGNLDLEAYQVEWKWDGIRVQVAARDGEARLYSRSGDDIGGAFPDILEAVRFHAVLDGELLVMRDGVVAPFNDLQQRLNRKTVSKRMRADHPAHVRLYDILFDGADDLRGLDFATRRARLEAWYTRNAPARFDLSPLLPVRSLEALATLRAEARAEGMEGLMLKRADSVYVAGRPKGPWFKWKRDALTLDLVLMYAQRGHGKRSSFYSDYTFGAWRTEDGGRDALVPVGKAYSGFTDEELRRLDRWVRNHTVERFGPVRAVEPALVLEVAFDSVHRSKRHKSGVAMRFPRIHRIRWDKPVREAERLETLERLMTEEAGSS